MGIAPSNIGENMGALREIITIGGLVIGYILLVTWILPKFGVPT
jgi:type IV secretory pathway TrbD component